MTARVLAQAQAAEPARDAEQVQIKTDGSAVEARSTSRTIRTVDDLLRHIEADMTRYEVATSEATKWEGMSVNRQTGKAEVTELFRVFVRLKPKAGPSVRECVEAMIEAAKGEIRRPVQPKPKPAKTDGRWAVLIVADPHLGKYSWRRTAGADYDLEIAGRLIRDSAAELLEVAGRYKPERMTVATLGDVFHYDTPGGTTTSGTPLERDGRLPKMLGDGTDAMLGVVDAAANVAATDVLVVAGNHDETLTFAFQRILVERFRRDRRVRIDGEFTSRKYLSHGKNLLGFCHGHRAKRKLPQLMAIEAAREWARCPYREIHVGHFHHQAAEWSRPIETFDGVLVRVAPALCPADDWHANEGYVGNRQAMELFIYDTNGGLTAMHVAGPTPTTPRR
ncbi:MAG: metallophosphoesterase [Planctomycetes bacterium]|nr:metallophosphoesterase [Planctomycetota bacterium]